MPLVRLRVRNEYAQGQPELYAGKDDPKAVLEGHAVAGLVGILRQLGDLAEFAAEVFHGLQEQVMTTASRSHKLTIRMQHIEAALPPLEKVVLAQTSHIHFAYTPGSEWHPRIRSERNHFIYNDLPQFIMDSYEECRGPPRLHLLDKFDIGGPGSCLKRYSDPTFFKKVSAGPDEANIEKARRDRKARKAKKKRQSKERRDVSHGASVSNARNYSVQQMPPVVDGRSSPSQTASSVDTGQKYDLGDNLHSFDSRADSGYIECIFRPSSSVQAEEQETNDSSPFMPVPHTDARDSVFLDEHVQYVDDNFQPSSVQEQPTSASSCVTWDEKAEIMEPSNDETLYAQQRMCDDDAHDHNHGSGNIQITDHMEICGGENARETVSSPIGVDEIESDPDNFMDALNTIESESEIDRDYSGKQDLERFYSISNNDETGGLDDHPVGSASHTYSINTDLPSSDFPKNSLSDNSCDEEIPSHLSNSCSPQNHASVQTPEITMECRMDHSAPVTGNADVLHCLEPESISAIPLDSAIEAADTPDLSGDKAATMLRTSEESLTDTVINGSVRIWTNGGLLGLAPSKPPDFMSSPIARDHVRNTRDMEDGTMKPSEGSSTSATYLDSIHGSSGTVVQNGNSGTGVVLPVASNANHGSMENENSSTVFGLSRRLLSNSLSRRLSDISDAKFEQVGSVNGYNGIPNQIVPETLFMEQFRYESAVSATASPPLQHMKISFHPVDGLEEASKLKLKFSDGTRSHESSRDIFPSFQLIPDSSIGQQDYGSDSDDDTFCRSSPFMSDDCLSRHSESNSEQWECGDGTEEGNDYEIYDALCGISSMELVPQPLDSAIDPILDLPSYDAVKPEFRHQAGDDTNEESRRFIADPSPTVPPLPPMEWRVSKPHADMMEATDAVSESFKHESSLKLVLKQATEELQHTNEAPVINPKIQEQQKLNKEKELSDDNYTSSDFLQQIRTKSFNLRPVTMAKAPSASGSAADVNVDAFPEKINSFRQAPTYPSASSIKVNAILEKANAIRQAVASDDGEDDNWSDT